MTTKKEKKAKKTKRKMAAVAMATMMTTMTKKKKKKNNNKNNNKIINDRNIINLQRFLFTAPVNIFLCGKKNNKVILCPVSNLTKAFFDIIKE